jgi:ubiquinone/menaquinone biosynthesis C-methylase UbiE
MPGESFDIVLATHVLEHVQQDHAALAEIFRVLKPNGIALLPVPIIAATTVEYGEPHAREESHVRAPGLDYFDRYRAAGFDVEVRSSDQFPSKYQLYIHEDRSNWMNADRPFVPRRNEYPHRDFLPICRKRK